MRITKTISQLLVTIVGIVLCSSAMLVLTAQHATVDSVRAVDAAAYHGMFNPGATLDTTQVDDTRGVRDTAWEDAEAEGRDVVPFPDDAEPTDLRDALAAHKREWRSVDDQAYLVPVGTVIDVPGGLYRATLDGWMSCVDFQTSDQECSATGPVMPVDVPEVAPVQAVAHVTDANPYGAGAGAKCGTDAQCAAYSRSIGEEPSGYAAVHIAHVAHVIRHSKRQPAEDSPRFNCATHGNHVCGPRYDHDPRAGCYRHGWLVVKWTRYDRDQYGNPSRDPLWAQITPPC